MSNKISERKVSNGQQQLKPNSIINAKQLSHFDMIDYDKFGVADYKNRKNPRNSFYAHKFKKCQQSSRPLSSQPEHLKPTKDEALNYKTQQPRNIGLMGSFYINTKPNTRRISRSLASYHAELMIRNASDNISPSKYNRSRGGFYKNQAQQPYSKHMAHKTPNQKMDDNSVDEMNQFFTTLKLNTYKRNNSSKIKDRSQIKSENKLRDGQRYFVLNYQQNLNIRGLKPNPSGRISHNLKKSNPNQNSYQKFTTQQIIPVFQMNQMNPKTIIKYKSSFNDQAYRKPLKKSSSPPGYSNRRQEGQGSPKKKQLYIVNYFGKLKDNSTLQDIQKMKALFYRDLIWKVWLNSNWKIKIQSYTNNTIQSPKFFVGRGNNSKLVKAILNRRWWWKMQTKQENANFLWSQLKIYSAIQSQIEYKKLDIFQIDDKIIQQKQQIRIDINEEFYNNKKHKIQQEMLKSTEQKDLHNLNQQTKGLEFKKLDIIKKIQLLSKQSQQIIYDQDWWNYKLSISDKNTFLMTHRKYLKWQKYLKNPNNIKKQLKCNQSLQNRKMLQKNMQIFQKYPEKVTNHLQYSRLIGNKKALYKTMSTYYELSKKSSKFLPLTYHITSGLQDQQYLKFLSQYFRKTKEENNSMWIVKPGEMSNRGCGIKVCKDIQDIKQILKMKKTHANGKPFTYIIQEYLREPFLYQGRKFDIRHYIMINSTFGRIKGYFYQQGYIRTTSYKYSTKNHDSYVHLTNDAVQKYCKDYGKYEKGNKVSYQDFQKYLKNLPDAKQKGYSFYQQILPKIRQISMDIMNASYYLIDPKRKGNNFEVFGLDIMIDTNFRPWLIQVNTNPCLQLSSPVLAKIIPKMLDNAFAISLDPLFPPPLDVALSSKKNNLSENFVNQNQFQLVFDEIIQGKKLNNYYDQIKEQLTQMEGYGSDQQAYESAEDQCDAEF